LPNEPRNVVRVRDLRDAAATLLPALGSRGRDQTNSKSIAIAIVAPAADGSSTAAASATDNAAWKSIVPSQPGATQGFGR